MSWFVPVVLPGILEAVRATELGRSEGVSRPGPALVFFSALAASMAGLVYAMKDLCIGTAYAVRVGIGTVLTVVHASATGEELVPVTKIVFLLMIIGGVLGLRPSH